jgi:hypothetical protein
MKLGDVELLQDARPKNKFLQQLLYSSLCWTNECQHEQVYLAVSFMSVIDMRHQRQ